MLDEGWLRSKLRMALEIESRDGITDIADGVWRLGDARRAPVLLARSLSQLWSDPSIAPKAPEVRGNPFALGIEWLPLEERFTLYGGGIALIGSDTDQSPMMVAEPWATYLGPFSADFRWVSLDDWPHGPIRCTEGQATVFKALWSFKGVKVDAVCWCRQLRQKFGMPVWHPAHSTKESKWKTRTPSRQAPIG